MFKKRFTPVEILFGVVGFVILLSTACHAYDTGIQQVAFNNSTVIHTIIDSGSVNSSATFPSSINTTVQSGSINATLANPINASVTGTVNATLANPINASVIQGVGNASNPWVVNSTIIASPTLNTSVVSGSINATLANPINASIVNGSINATSYGQYNGATATILRVKSDGILDVFYTIVTNIMSALNIASGSSQTTGAYFTGCDGFAALHVGLSNTSNNVTIQQQCSVDNSTWFNPIDQNGNAIGAVQTALAGRTGAYIQYPPVLTPYVRYNVTANTNSTITLDLVTRQQGPNDNLTSIQ